MRKTVLLLVTGIMVVLMGCVTTGSSQTARRGAGGRIEVIEGWELRDDARTTHAQIASISPEAKNLPKVDFHTVSGLEKVGSGVSPDSFLTFLTEAFEKKGAKVESTESVTLAGLPAKRATLSYSDMISQVTVTTYWERPFWLICTAKASEFDSYTESFEELANNVSFYPLTEEQDVWIRREGEPLGVIKSPLGQPEDLHHIACAGFAEDWTKDGKIDGIAIGIDFLAEDQTVGKIQGWHNTRFVVDIELTRKETNEVVYTGTHYGIDWMDFPVATEPTEHCWIPTNVIEGGFDPEEDMGAFIMDVTVETAEQGTLSATDENCPHPSKRSE